MLSFKIFSNFNLKTKIWVKYLLLKWINNKKFKAEKEYPSLTVDFIKAHKTNCQKLKIKANINRIRLYLHINGSPDENYITEEYYKYYIQPFLNLSRYSSTIFQNKAFIDFLPKVFPELAGLFIQNHIKKINGVFYDGDLNMVKNPEEIIRELDVEKLVFKKVLDTGSSRGVQIFQKKIKNGFFEMKTHENLNDIIIKEDDFIIQQFIEQHPFLAKHNKSSVNTTKVITYRSVVDEKVHVLHQYMRVGASGEYVDTLKKGGHIRVNPDGNLNDYIVFKDYSTKKNPYPGKYPENDKIIYYSKLLAKYFPYHRVLGLDFVVDKDSNVFIVEVNTGITPEATNILSGSIFGQFTEEIMNFVNKKKKENNVAVYKYI